MPTPVRALPLGLTIGLGALASILTVACNAEPNTAIALARPAAPGSCMEWIGQPVDRTCIPHRAKADVPLVLEIEERCGACGSTVERCSVTVEGRTVTLSLDGRACEPAVGTQCPEACGKGRIKCNVPPLTEGRYEVRYGDTSGRVDVFDVSQEPDSRTSCALDDIKGGG